MSQLISWMNDPINWYDCYIEEADHAARIVSLCFEVNIRIMVKKTNAGTNIFVHLMDMDSFKDIINEYTTLQNVHVDIDCITPAADASDIPENVDIQQKTAVTSEYIGMTLAVSRMKEGSVIMMLSDGDELTAKRISYIDWEDSDENYLDRECSFSGEFITDNYSAYVYAG